MRFYALDAFRFAAALAVVLYHYTVTGSPGLFPNLAKVTQYGYLGVPLFFMISGFVISASAERRSAIRFLISRAVRLYPTYWMAVTLTVLIAVTLGDDSYSWYSYIANMTMLNNYLDIPNIDDVYWTLQVELKFYGCVFLLIALKVFHQYKVWLSAWSLLALTHLMTGQPFFMGWFISPSYSPYFISGVAFFLIWKEGRSHYLSSVLALSTLMSSIKAFQQSIYFIPDNTLFSATVAAVLVLVFHVLFYLIATNRLVLPSSQKLLVMGGLTYPLYLIHSKSGEVLIGALDGPTSRLLAIAITTLLVFAASYMMYRYLETPFSRRLKTILDSVFLQKKNTTPVN